MIVAIDESGDPGFNIEAGASACFAFSALVFRDTEQAAIARSCIRAGMMKHRVSPEYRFSKCDNPRRRAFFEVAAPIQFEVYLVVFPKMQVASALLRADSEAFVEFCIARLLTLIGPKLPHATVLFDGKPDKEKRRKLKKLITRVTPPAAIKDVLFRQSHSEPLLQMADMYVGAAARCWDAKLVGAASWRALIEPKVVMFDVFE
jgi:hypothetical protein